MLLYAHAEKKTDLVCGLLWSGKLKDEYRCVSAALESVDWADVGSLGEARENLPREYAKFVDSFLAAYAEPESRAASKRLRWQRSREEQLRKGVSTTEICRALGLNIGNVNAYLKDGTLDKVSLSNATKIMKHLMAL